MEPAQHIVNFLNRVRKKYLVVQAAHLTFLVFGIFLVGVLVGAGIGFIFENAYAYRIPYFLIWLAILFFCLVRFFQQTAAFRLDQTALRVEDRVPGLNNSLINSLQLAARLKGSADRKDGMSHELIGELIRRTRDQIEKINPSTLVSWENTRASRNLAASTLILSLALLWLSPEYFTRGANSWFSQSPPTAHAPRTATDASAPASRVATDYIIENLALTFNYPAYTQLPPAIFNPSNGKVQVLPGTEVRIEAGLNHPVAGAELNLNGRDQLAMNVPLPTQITGRFIAREPGYYQFQLKSPAGHKTLLPTRYPISLERDQPPSIKIFLANPKPMYYLTDRVHFFYETHDDYGVRKIDLVFTQEGRTHRQTLKKIKGTETDLKGGYIWELSATGFQPGDSIQYYLEVWDNDNVFGPNSGQSEMFSFEMFDAREKRLDLLALQDQMVEKMVSLLAESLVVNTSDLKNSPRDLAELKGILASSTDQLIGIIRIAQSIEGQAQAIDSFPKHYLTLLGNIIDDLNKIREEQIQSMNQISNAIVKATPIGYNFPPVESVTSKLIRHLERDILLLIKVINRERMDQVMAMERELTNLAESLREEFEKLKNRKTPLDSAHFQAALKKIQETMQKIMEQLARQNQALADEFLNQNAFENMNMENFSASLEKLMDLVNKGKIEEALEELEKFADELRAFSNQLEDLNANQESLVDMEVMRKLDESIEQVEELEKSQNKLLEQTTELNKALRSHQAEKFEDRLSQFFADLKKDVQVIQAILEGDSRFLANHSEMKKLADWMDQQEEISQKIRELNQKTVDSVTQPNLRDHFKILNETRKNLAKVAANIQSLRLKMFLGFKNFLPELMAKYNQLHEYTELMDLNDFNALFKQTFPEVFRWQNHFNTSRYLNRELHDRMNEDLLAVSRLNSEISKKLGTLLRDLENHYQSLITPKNKKDMLEMAQEEQALKNDSDSLAAKLKDMSRQNPMISQDLARNMKGASRYMKRAGKQLQQHRIPESIEAENKALGKLAETRDMLNQLKDSGSGKARQRRSMRLGPGQARDNFRGGGRQRMRQEKVKLPGEDQFRVPGQFREEILEAMKNQYPKKYQRLVSEYYKELVK